MKFTRKKGFKKLAVIKQNYARTDYFRQKEFRIKFPLLYSNINQMKSLQLRPHKYQVEPSASPLIPSIKKTQPESISLPPRKNWWIHVWSGLVLDRQGKHQRVIRQAIWLYLYFLLVANRQTGRLYRKLSTIANETGFNPRSIQRWLYTLRRKGYIESRSTGRYLEISITKWKPISRRAKLRNLAGKERIGLIPTNNSSPHDEQFKQLYRKTSQ